MRRASAPSKLPTIQERSAEDPVTSPRAFSTATNPLREEGEQGGGTDVENGKRRKSMSALRFDCGHLKPLSSFYEMDCSRLEAGGEVEEWTTEVKQSMDSILTSSAMVPRDLTCMVLGQATDAGTSGSHMKGAIQEASRGGDTSEQTAGGLPSAEGREEDAPLSSGVGLSESSALGGRRPPHADKKGKSVQRPDND